MRTTLKSTTPRFHSLPVKGTKPCAICKRLGEDVQAEVLEIVLRVARSAKLDKRFGKTINKLQEILNSHEAGMIPICAGHHRKFIEVLRSHKLPGTEHFFAELLLEEKQFTKKLCRFRPPRPGREKVLAPWKRFKYGHREMAR